MIIGRMESHPRVMISRIGMIIISSSFARTLMKNEILIICLFIQGNFIKIVLLVILVEMIPYTYSLAIMYETSPDRKFAE